MVTQRAVFRPDGTFFSADSAQTFLRGTATKSTRRKYEKNTVRKFMRQKKSTEPILDYLDSATNLTPKDKKELLLEFVEFLVSTGKARVASKMCDDRGLLSGDVGPSVYRGIGALVSNGMVATELDDTITQFNLQTLKFELTRAALVGYPKLLHNHSTREVLYVKGVLMDKIGITQAQFMPYELEHLSQLYKDARLDELGARAKAFGFTKLQVVKVINGINEATNYHLFGNIDIPEPELEPVAK